MKGDFTRKTFDRPKHYSGVLMQQGRVQLDADWNENLAIGSHLLQTLTRDVIGECGVPIHVDAYKIDVPAPIVLPTQPDFSILAGPQGKGRMYVSGLLIETENDTTYLTQPDWLSAPAGATLANLGPQSVALSDGETRVDLVYVDVWPRTISAIEDPHIREVALGGPDTAERVKLIWQVKVKTGVGPNAKCNMPIGVPSLGGGTAQLIVASPPVPPDPCEPTAQGGYQGPDNRFYRIEVHEGGPLGTATFKWSRDNGSVVAAIEQFKTVTEIVVKSLGRDDTLKFKAGDFVEVTDDATDLSGLPGTIAKITVDEASRTLTLNTPIPDAVRLATGRHPKVRRWDGGDAQLITAAAIDLEAGLKVQFGSTGTDFRPGDYWTFAARVVDGSIDPDSIKNAPTRPMGVHHVFCNLALITWTRAGDTVTARVEDCRLVFPPLTEIPTGEDCCTVTVGDGVTSHGDFADIQAAIDSLRNGGRVCILPGEYRLSRIVELRGKVDVIISGCGPQTRITAPGDEPAVVIDDSARIKLESLTVNGRSRRGVIVINASRVVDVIDCAIGNIVAGDDRPPTLVFLEASAGGPAIVVFDSLVVTIAKNALFGLPALSLQAQIAEVDDNRSSGGGLWVRDGSSQVNIHDNDIARGLGAGIMLGGLGQDEKLPERQTGVDNVQIFDNRISGMAGSGISTMRPPGDRISLAGVVSDLTIADNRIAACVTLAGDQITNEIALGGIVLRDVTQARIHHNTIIDNGAAANVAANGIFVFFCEGLEIADNSITDNGTTASRAPTDCVDFSAMQPDERKNPRVETGAMFTVFDSQGNQANQTSVVTSGAVTGLDCGFKTEVALDATTSSVELALASFSSPGFLEAFNEDGSSAGTVQVNPGDQPQTVTLHGAAIRRVTIVAPQNEILLQKLCVDVSGAGFQAGIAAIYAIGLNTLNSPGGVVAEGRSRFGETIPAAVIHDNVVICPQGHSLIAIGLGPMSIADNTLISRGVRRQPDLPNLPILGQAPAVLINALIQLTSSVMIYDLGRPRDAVPSLNPAVGTHFTTDFTTTTFRASTFAQQLLLPDGRVAFDGNQVTLQDFDVRARILPSVPVLILSFDDVSLHHNQINTEIPQALVLIDALVGGTTLRASDNRLTELPRGALLSCYSFGQLNITSENQTTHCIVARGGQVIRTDNQQLIPTLCERLTALLGGK